MIGGHVPIVTGSGSGTFSDPHPYDEEFNGSGSSWTFAGSTSPDVNSTSAGRIYMPAGSAAQKNGLPSYPFTVTAFCSAITFTNIATTYANATLGVCEASPLGSPGPVFWGLEWDVDTLGKISIYDGRFANFAATPTHLGTKTNETVGLALQVPHYQRIVATDATHYELQYSTDGTTYTSYGSGFNPTLTAGGIILISFGCVTEWDWVRFT